MSNINLSKIGNSDNTLAIVDSRVPNRWLDAWGAVDKAVIDKYNAGDWTITATGTAPVAASLLPDAEILISTQASTDFSGDNMQILGSRFRLEAGRPLYFGARVTLSEATQSDFIVGLCGIDTALTAASSTHGLDIGAGGVFFSKLDAVTTCNFKTFQTTTENNTAVALTMDTLPHTYEILWDGAALTGRVDGVEVAKFTTTLPSVVLTPSIAFRKGDTAAGVYTCTIHEFRCIAVRG
jgi:hypothetical protein